MPKWRAVQSRSRRRARRAAPDKCGRRHMPNLKARPCDEAAIRSTAAVAGCRESARRWVLAVTIMASTIAYIDESVVNVALPTIEADLKTSAAVVQWLVNAYMLSLTALVLVGD